MKKILCLLVLAGLALGGCGNNACEDAADKAKECKLTDSSATGSGDCSGAAECTSKCFNDSSCEEINSTDINGKFFKCLSACQ